MRNKKKNIRLSTKRKEKEAPDSRCRIGAQRDSEFYFSCRKSWATSSTQHCKRDINS